MIKATRLADERGVALTVAMFALAMIGALVASSFFAGRLEQQSGQNTFWAGQAREAAEAGLTQAMADLDAAVLKDLPVGGVPLDLGIRVIGERVVVQSQVTRLTSRVFLLRAQGQRQDAAGTTLATRSLAFLAQLSTTDSLSVTGIDGLPALERLAERSWIQLH
jgi:hypothetical protein